MLAQPTTSRLGSKLLATCSALLLSLAVFQRAHFLVGSSLCNEVTHSTLDSLVEKARTGSVHFLKTHMWGQAMMVKARTRADEEMVLEVARTQRFNRKESTLETVGMLHGAIWTFMYNYRGDTEGLAKLIPTLFCPDSSHWNCFHGVGHGLLLYFTRKESGADFFPACATFVDNVVTTSRAFEQARDVCSTLEKPWGCFHGLHHALFESSFVVAPRMENVFFPCNITNPTYADTCFLYVFHQAVNNPHQDWRFFLSPFYTAPELAFSTICGTFLGAQEHLSLACIEGLSELIFLLMWRGLQSGQWSLNDCLQTPSMTAIEPEFHCQLLNLDSRLHQATRSTPFQVWCGYFLKGDELDRSRWLRCIRGSMNYGVPAFIDFHNASLSQFCDELLDLGDRAAYDVCMTSSHGFTYDRYSALSS